jgi:hypothetical protein
MTFQPEFPSECSNVIFSFLDMTDCLNVGATSIIMMKEVLPSINNRRMRMKDRFCIVVERTELGCADIFIESKQVGRLDKMISQYPTSALSFIPTTQERVSKLIECMPRTHPLYCTLNELNTELNITITKNDIDNVPINYKDIFAAYRRILRPIQLYVLLISNVIRSDPLSQSQCGGKTSLDQYIGDVLCMTHLFHQHSPNLKHLNTIFSRQLQDLCKRITTGPSYISWVLLHCSILRTKQFSSEERKRLGFCDDRFREGDPTIIPLRCFINDKLMSSQMTLVQDTFGSLGPSFRMRDNVQIHELPSHCIVAYLNSLDRVHSNNSISRGAAGEIAAEWLCRAHESVRKVRPITVRQPFLRFSAQF